MKHRTLVFTLTGLAVAGLLAFVAIEAREPATASQSPDAAQWDQPAARTPAEIEPTIEIPPPQPVPSTHPTRSVPPTVAPPVPSSPTPTPSPSSTAPSSTMVTAPGGHPAVKVPVGT